MLELQKMWQQYDARITENTRINKEILKRILWAKPERRISWNKFQSWYSLIALHIAFWFPLIPNMKIRNQPEFYMGVVICLASFSCMYYWAIKDFLLVRRIKFSEPITVTRKNVNNLEKYKAKVMKLGFWIAPVYLFGIILLCKLPFMTVRFIVFISVITLLMIITSYIHSLIRKDRFKKLNAELDELEELEKE